MIRVAEKRAKVAALLADIDAAIAQCESHRAESLLMMRALQTGFFSMGGGTDA